MIPNEHSTKRYSDIKTIDNALDKVMNMRGVSFTKQAEKGIGVIALFAFLTSDSFKAIVGGIVNFITAFLDIFI